MIDLKNISLVFDLLNCILILDEENHIVYTGDEIEKLLFRSTQYDEHIFLNNFSHPKEKELWERKIADVRNIKQPSLLNIDRIKKTLFLFPVNLNETLNVIISTQEKILQTSKIEFELKERIKELQCLYTIGFELDSNERVNQTLKNCISPLSQAFQFAEFTSVRIAVDGEVYGNADVSNQNVKCILMEDIVVNKIKRGALEIFYHQPAIFLNEEKNLLKQISTMISKSLEKQDLKVELQKHLEKLEDLINDLEKQKKVLISKNKKLLHLTEEAGKSKKQLESLFNAITDAIIVIDADFDIIMSNKKEIGNSGKCYQKIFNENSPCINCPAKIAFKAGESVSIEKVVSNEYFLLNDYPILNNTGQVENILEICSNVTKEKQIEFQLLQSYKLASLGKLVAGVAHEINNPNTFIRGNIKIIKESFDDIFPILDKYFQEKKELQIARLNYGIFKENIPVLLDDMVEGSNRIKKIVDGLRNFAKKDDESFDEIVDINQVIQSGYRLVENQIKKNAKVRLKLALDIPEIKGNIQKIEQVVVNMLINASQAIENGKGIIEIETKLNGSKKEILVLIRDTGKGIDEKTRKYIFDPFFTTKRDKGGTGLGLSISYGIIKDHGGRIEVDSAIQNGTTFTIHFPVYEGVGS